MFPKPMVACGSVIVETFERGGICTDVYDYLVRGVTGDGGSGGGMVQGYELLPTSLPKYVVTEGFGVFISRCCQYETIGQRTPYSMARIQR